MAYLVDLKTNVRNNWTSHFKNSTRITYQQICCVVALRFGAVDHVPMVADQHPLLEQRSVGTSVAKLPSQSVTHVVDLPEIKNPRLTKSPFLIDIDNPPDNPFRRLRSIRRLVHCKKNSSWRQTWTIHRWAPGTAVAREKQKKRINNVFRHGNQRPNRRCDWLWAAGETETVAPSNAVWLEENQITFSAFTAHWINVFNEMIRQTARHFVT